MKLLAIKTKRLQKALDNYFDTRDRNGGGFKSGEKDPIIRELMEAAGREGRSITIVPGVVWLQSKRKTLRLSHKNRQGEPS